MGDIEQMAKESRENVERLSRDLEGYWRDQEDVLGRVKPLLGTWGVVRRVLESQSVLSKGGVRRREGGGMMVSRMGSGFVLLFFVVVTVLTLIHGLRTARKSLYHLQLSYFQVLSRTHR